jgi:hypothetical protein
MKMMYLSIMVMLIARIALLAPQAEQLSLHSTIHPSGAAFTVPGSWSIQTGAFVVLEAPEKDSHVAIVDVRAPDAAAAAGASLTV